MKTRTATKVRTRTKAGDSVCAQCGRPFFIDLEGVSHHTGDGPAGVDYDRDADHTAYGDEGEQGGLT